MNARNKRVSVVALVFLLVGGGWLAWALKNSAVLDVRLVGRTNDTAGEFQITFEITNRTSKEVIFALASVETKNASGWHSSTNRDAQRELGITRALQAQSVAAVKVVAAPGEVAVRGEIQYQRDESRLKNALRATARRIGLPRSLVDPSGSVFGDRRIPVGSIQLPAVDTSGQPFLLATTAVGVWPEPDPPHRNFTFRATDVATILAIYREMCGGELEVSPQVAALRTKIAVEPDHDLTPPEALRLIEAALHKQAGILIMRQASNRFTATLSQ